MHLEEQSLVGLDRIFHHFLREESGASLTEIVLLASLAVVVLKLVLLAVNRGA